MAKRKQKGQEGQGTKSKRTKLSVKITSDEDNKVIAAKFCNGELQRPTDVQFSLFKKKQSSDVTLVAETERLSYIANNIKAPDPYYKYAVGVLDTNANTMQVLPALMANLEPSINKHAETDTDDKDQTITYPERINALTAAFGSAKGKRAMQSRINNKLGQKVLDDSVGTAAHNIITQQGDDTVKNIITPTKDNENIASVLPPFDRNATRASDVYKLRDLFSETIRETLTTEAHELKDASPEQIKHWATEEKYSSFVLEQAVVMPVQEEARLARAQLLLYYNYLVRLYHTKYAQLRKKKDPLPLDWPVLLRHHMYDVFMVTSTDSEGQVRRSLPTRMKDKVALYMILLALHVEQFTLLATHIMKDLKSSQAKCTLQCKALGCHVKMTKTQGENISTITLPLPLTFPEVRSSKKSKGRQ